MATGKLMGRIGDLEDFTAVSFQPDSRALSPPMAADAEKCGTWPPANC